MPADASLRQYVSEPSSTASSMERHQQAASPDSRDETLGDPPSSPTDTVVPNDVAPSETAKSVLRKEESVSRARHSSPNPTLDDSAAPDVSADYLDESSIESSVIIIASEGASSEPAPAPVLASDGQQSNLTGADVVEPASSATCPIAEPAAAASSKHVLPLPDPTGSLAHRIRQTSTSSLLKINNPIKAYLKSDLPYEPQDGLDARDVIEIEDGAWVGKIPPFHVAVPSYSQRRVTGGNGEYTVFQVVSSITLPNRQSQAEPSVEAASSDQARSSHDQQLEVRQITVDRRYTHFQHLHTILKASLPLLTIPDLPGKRLTGNFNPDFLNARRRDLGRYLSRIARHKLIRSNKAFLDFLGNENEEAYDVSLPRMLMQALRSEPERFFTRIRHDSDYFDEQQLLEEVTEEHNRMARHVRAVEKGQATSAIYDGLSQYRERLQGIQALFYDT